MKEALISILGKIYIPDWLIELIWPAFPFIGVLFMSMFFGVVFLVLMERRTLALVTVRKGPNRVGYDGIFQSFADGIKIMFKEDIINDGANKIIFTIAPALVMIPTLVIYAVLPFTQGLVATNLAVGLLFVIAISSIPTIALVLAGWSSNNKYSLLGGLRSAAQAISYEIPFVISALAVVILVGSMNLTEIVAYQANTGIINPSSIDNFLNISTWRIWNYNCFAGFLGCIVFLICAIAEANRIPFDLPEAEQELVSGYSTEYSGMKFAMFFMAEYAALLAIAILTIVLYFGGFQPFYNDYVVNILIDNIETLKNLPLMTEPFRDMLVNIEQAGWFTFKIWLFIFTAMWIRATLPRFRVDHMMGFCWKFLLPISLLNLLVVTVIKMIFI